MVINPVLSFVINMIPYIIGFIMICIFCYAVYSYVNIRRKHAANSSIDLKTSETIDIFGTKIKKRIINKLFLVLSSLPLLVYPFILMGMMVSVAAMGQAENVFVALPGLLFFLYIVSYLPIYIICVAKYHKKKDKSILFSIFPLAYISPLLILIFFF